MKKIITLLTLLALSIGISWAEDQTVTLDNETKGFSSIKTGSSASTYTLSINDIIYTFNRDTQNSKDVTYNSEKSSIKFQGGTSFTISSDGTISKVVFTQTAGESFRTFTASETGTSFTNSDKVYTWEGTTNSVTFTNSSSDNAYMTSIEVTYTPALKLTSTIPSDGATDQADRTIILKFNEQVTVADASGITISPNDGVTLGTPTLDATDPKKVNIPCSGLKSATKYTVTIADGAIKDEASNAYAGSSFSFITAITAPTINPNGGSITANTNVTLSSDDGTTIKYAWGTSAMSADDVKANGSDYSTAITITPDNIPAPYLTAIAYKVIDGTTYYSNTTTSNAFADGTSIGVTAKTYPYSWIYDNNESGVNWGNTATQVAASGSGWSGSDNYYHRDPSTTGEGYDGIDAVEGLKFTGGFVGLDWGYGHMYVGGGTKITIPSLTTTYKITIKAGVGSNGGTITATNADVDGVAYTPELTSDREEYVWYVTANGNVSFTFSEETWINYIKVEEIEKQEIAIGREGTWQTVSTYSDGASIDLQMAKVSPTVPTSLLHVTSSNETVMTVKSVTFGTSSSGRQRVYFSLNVLKVGTSDITISFEGNDRYNSTSYTETFTVNKPSQQLSYATTQVTKYPGADAFTNKLTKTLVKGELTYSSSDTNVANVDNKGKVTIVGSGSCNIIATAAETDTYAETSASYLLVVVESFNYSLAKDDKINPSQEITNVAGIIMRYGGFTNEFGTGGKHEYNNGLKGDGVTLSTTEDKFKVSTDDTGLDGTYYAIPSGGNPLFEYEDKNTAHTNVRGWDRMQSTTDYLGNNVPVFGAYYVFEPQKDGDLTVSVLQTGAIQDVGQSDRNADETYKLLNEKESYNGGIIDKWDYKALYLSDERGYTVQATSKKSYTNYSHPYIYESELLTNDQRDKVSLRTHIVGETFGGDTPDKYAYQFTYGETTTNEGTKIEGESSCEELKTEIRKAFGLEDNAELTDEVYSEKLSTNRLTDIMENKRHGYWTFTKSHNVYTFPVKAGKTYYLFTDGSKLGFNGFSFAANNTSSSLTIEGADNAENATKMGAKANCTVTLNRKIYKNQPNTLMLPFSMSVSKVKEVFGKDTRVLHVTGIDNVIHFTLHHHQMIVAGEPCIIYPTFEGKETQTDNNREYIESFVISNVTVEEESVLNRYQSVSDNGYTFIGCFKKTDMNAGSYWVSATADGKTPEGQTIYIHETPEADYMTNTRAFFQKGADSSAKLGSAIIANAIEEEDNSEPTGISIIQAEEQRTQTARKGVYTINGQKVDGTNLQKGIYIIDGKKVVVK